jgi:LCP family protein required for cell wall assembly
MGDDRREWLLVRTSGSGEARVNLNGVRVRIGRGPDNAVALDDSFASARHAELVAGPAERYLRDLGSRNGTRLNGRPLAPDTLTSLQSGDVIQIGRSEVVYVRDLATDVVMPVPPLRREAEPDRGAPAAGWAAPSPERASAPARQRGGFGRVGRVALWLAATLLAMVVVVGGVAWLLAPPRVTLLVLGSDARPDELHKGQVGRTDTLLTVVADRSPAEVAMISLPRDLWVPIPGFGEERINAAYAIGGPKVAERVVGDTLGVGVDRYLLIGLQGVRDVVDAAGGVDIDVATPIHDDAYPTDDYGTIVLDIPAGHLHMDGETALRYARTRHQDNDFGRIARQQQVMAALRSAMLRPTNWWRIPAVIGAVRSATKTDLGPLDLATLAFATGGSSASPDRLAVGLDLVEEFRGDDGAYLLRVTPALRQRVAALLTPSSAAVGVLNGSTTAGLATRAADTLRARGMHVVNVGDAAASQRDATIEVKPGLTRAGVSVAVILGLPSGIVHESAALPDGTDVRVTLGEAQRRP